MDETVITTAEQRWFRSRLSRWHQSNRRSFPWRETTDPFQILVAEMMLRRTRAAQVAPVYQEFISRYRSPADLASVEPDEVRAVLRPLGLNWRIEQFQVMARELVDGFGGAVPDEREELLTLTGVSDYVADAVLVFAFGRRRGLLDNPIARVLARYFALPERAESRRDRRIIERAARLAGGENPRDHNFALLDLAAAVCTPRSPKHADCPLALRCAGALEPTSLRKETIARVG